MTVSLTAPPPSTDGKERVQHPPVIALGQNAWSRDSWQTRQQLLSRLAARGWPIAYSRGALSVWERTRPTWRAARWTNRVQWRDGVEVLEGGRLLARWPRFALLNRLAVAYHARTLREIAGRHRAGPGILHLFGPQFALYARCLPSWRVVYHIEDAYDLMPNWSAHSAESQAWLIDRADLVIACARSMVRGLPESDRVRLLPNGVDCAAYEAGARLACPADLAAVPRPRIGYIGSLNRKVDYDLIDRVAAARPDWHWVLIGPTVVNGNVPQPERSSFEVCQRRPNVHLLGAKDFAELPAYAAHMDVNTICYRADADGWWHACDPLKLSEYLAAGPPVVSADIENVRPYDGLVELARDYTSWVDGLTRALADNGPARRTARVAAARQRDWTFIVDRLEAWLTQVAA